MSADMLPWALDESPAASLINSAHDVLLGKKFRINDKVYRVVEAAEAVTLTDGFPKVWEYADRDARTVHLVDSANAAILAGVSDASLQSVAIGDYLLLQVGGRANVQQSDGTQITAGNLVMGDGDASTDDGKVAQAGDNTVDTSILGRAITGGVAADAELAVELFEWNL